MAIDILTVAMLLAGINGLLLQRRVRKLESTVSTQSCAITTLSGNVSTLRTRSPTRKDFHHANPRRTDCPAQ
ncbi:hypothetical protein K3M67_02925 [Sphingobium sp. V4]|uniref:hypothetical protein n=1 Tax=Sphingobium sp. V4 TaxID=3038927 RepID=UPI002557FAB5|nr:hypothetical protein [Sphingobium sp. V4]WIW88949.1 hypothetical protein K3M67_02925 [Sphingobium sp. V4]